MEKGVPPHPFPCLFCGVSGLPGNQEPEVPPPRVPIACEDEINSIENRWTYNHRKPKGRQADILVRPYTSAQWHPAHVPLLFMADERDALLL